MTRARSQPTRPAQTVSTSSYVVCALAWALPGAGHLWLGRSQKGMLFLVVLLFMFGFGLRIEGQLFPFVFNDPLVFLEAAAQLGLGIPYLVTRVLGGGDGRVVAMTYEYGNMFVIVAGLLNMLVVLDVFDIMTGRKG